MREKTAPCVCCGCELKYENDRHYQDDAFEINGEIVCEDCITDYVRENCYKTLTLCN